jgi:PAS domain S-box-containing protein
LALPQLVAGAHSCCPRSVRKGQGEEVASDAGDLCRPDGSRDEDLLSSLDALNEAFFRMGAVRDAAGHIVDFEYLFCNRAALRLLGRRREELLGRRLLDLFPSHRSNGLLGAFARVTESGEPLRMEFAFDEGGVAGEFEVVVSRVGDGYVLAGHDISDRKRLERELVTVKDQLQAALSSRIVIEQAKGFVAGQLKVTPDTAFLAIRRYARGHDLRIGDVARGIITGEITLGKW